MQSRSAKLVQCMLPHKFGTCDDDTTLIIEANHHYKKANQIHQWDVIPPSAKLTSPGH